MGAVCLFLGGFGQIITVVEFSRNSTTQSTLGEALGEKYRVGKISVEATVVIQYNHCKELTKIGAFFSGGGGCPAPSKEAICVFFFSPSKAWNVIVEEPFYLFCLCHKADLLLPV